MNLPNKLTLLRVFMIPIFLVLYFWEGLPYHFLWAGIVFGIAAITDTLDGQIARKRGLVTDFGKLMDPLADKLLVISALVCLLGSAAYQFTLAGSKAHTISLLALIVILAREFTVTSIRLLAANKGVVIAADRWGKLKTISQMIWIPLVLLGLVVLPLGVFPPVLVTIWKVLEDVLFVLMVGLTVGSGINYIWKNRSMVADA